jgi:flagellar protein FlaG
MSVTGVAPEDEAMVGNLTAVTAAPARTSAPSGQNSVAITLPTGKAAPASGKALPVEQAPPPNQDLERAVRKLNERLAASQRNLSFRVDEGSGRTVITVVDATTNQVIRQIPSQEVLDVSRALESTSALLDAHA